MDGSEKIPISLPFSKLVLDDVKAEILLISWHFLVIFWLRPTHPFIDTLIFWYIKGVQWYISWPSFIYVWLFVVFKSWNFKCFHTSRKYNFWCGQICLTFWPVLQCNAVHQACHNFYFILKSTWNWAQKPIFWLILRGLVYTFLHPMSYTPIFWQIKRLMEVHNCGKFH